jgi:formamidopyrimidine-DNA glycosylase
VHEASHLLVYPDHYEISTSEHVLSNRVVSSIKRHGKYIILEAADSAVFVIHLRMTGRIYFNTEPQFEKHVHLILELSNGLFFHYHDVRKFGRFQFVPDPKDLHLYLPAGTDGLLITAAYIDQLKIQYAKKTLKSLLLDQKIIAGIGNIYADEICFKIKRHPLSVFSSIPAAQLAESIVFILNNSIRSKGTTFRDYRDADGNSGNFQNSLYVYAQAVCCICHSNIEKIKAAGRTSHFCPVCQSLK